MRRSAATIYPVDAPDEIEPLAPPPLPRPPPYVASTAKSGMPVIVWVMIGLGVVVGIWMAVTLLSNSDSESDGTFPTLGIDLSGGAGDSQISANQTLTGTGDGSTTSFRLSGDYSVSLNAGGDCYYAFDLERTDRERGEDLGSITDPGSTSTQLYNLPATTYYVDVITGPSPSCPWTVTISG